jgi:AraC-like DNA-binding protein
LTVRISTDDATDAMRLDYWRERVAEVLPPFELRVDDEGRFQGSLVSETVGALQVSRITSSQATVARPEELINASEPKLYRLDLQLRDRRTVTQNGRIATLAPGDFTLYDVSRPYLLTLSAARMQSAAVVTFPQDLLPLADDLIERVTVVRISGKSGTGALLSSLLARLANGLGNSSYKMSDGIRISTALLNLISASVGELQMSSTLARDDPPFLLRILSFIELRLDRPELSPVMIARAHRISIRYLHKLFAEEGITVAGWIRERRLERCRRDLTDPAQLHRTVGSIGAQWGFVNPPHFSHTFRQAFGMPPSEFRRKYSQVV